ncbi:MAG: DEAD/DEAH box helicase [bacterium]|nr:DEAD/DEAH box helicase [bacterium]
MLVHQPTQSLLLKHPDPFSIREVLSNSRTLDHADYNTAVQHTLDSTKVLRNMGIDAPAPIRFQYDWPGKFTPFAHQITMAEFLTLHRRCFNLSEMGSAKTNATIWAADWLMQTGRVDKTLVLAPLSTLERVWQADIFDTVMHRTCTIVHGSRDKRKAALDADVDFYIMNHDGLGIAEIVDLIHKRPDINLIVVDEASMFRNSSTRKFKALEKLCKRQDVRLWMMTGTPCPNDPTDAWALAKLVSPERVPKFFGQFKRDTMLQISQFKWVPKADAYTTAFKAMQPAVRFKKRDCIDLPPVTQQDHQAELTTEQRRAFEDLKKTMLAEAKDGKQITAVNAADKIGKLRQILCGAIKVGDNEYQPLDHAPRLKVLLEAISSASAKVLVVAPFKGIVRELEKEIGKHYSVGVLNGDVSPKERNRIINEFKMNDDPHVLLCHPKVMSHGLNLTEADTLIFYAPIYSNDEFQQVSNRFDRAGQTRKMTIIRMAAHPLEWEIYKLLDARKAGQNSILNLYKVVTE